MNAVNIHLVLVGAIALLMASMTTLEAQSTFIPTPLPPLPGDTHSEATAILSECAAEVRRSNPISRG